MWAPGKERIKVFMKILKTNNGRSKPAEREISQLEQRGGTALDTVLPKVRKIMRDVRSQGDQALERHAKKFDGLEKDQWLDVTPEETAEAWQQLDPALQDALRTAVESIRSFAERQMPANFDFAPIPGLTTGQQVRPIPSVGCYVPGGRHPLPSTMLMTVIPAQVAGVQRIVVVSPRPAPEILATAYLLGITEFYRVGGAHAIAALAFGTQSIPRVAKIVGPGNLFVTAAKREAASDPTEPCAIDMLAGPTEIVVTSDEGSPINIAADLVAQAEHDPEALAIFITTRESLAREVLAETRRQASQNPVAKQAIASNGYIFLASSTEEAQAITNRLAPEHLTVDSPKDLAWIQNAGSVFIGQYSPQPMGDYISGPNHTLPTGGMARLRGGLSVNDFVKLITVQQYSPKALATLGPKAIRIAEAEGLTAHAEAIRSRMKPPSSGKRAK
jgi:histidinol dehydrogenase